MILCMSLSIAIASPAGNATPSEGESMVVTARRIEPVKHLVCLLKNTYSIDNIYHIAVSCFRWQSDMCVVGGSMCKCRQGGAAALGGGGGPRHCAAACPGHAPLPRRQPLPAAVPAQDVCAVQPRRRVPRAPRLSARGVQRGSRPCCRHGQGCNACRPDTCHLHCSTVLAPAGCEHSRPRCSGDSLSSAYASSRSCWS